MLKEIAHYLVYSVFSMAQGSRLSGALEFFIYNTIKIFFLLSVIIFTVSIIRSYFPPERSASCPINESLSVTFLQRFSES
jgi:uncharacterized membrane protein YraQ (UPF0718 family)